MDPRFELLAKNLVQYSCEVKRGERVLIHIIDEGIDLAQALIREIYRVGGYPYVELEEERISAELMYGCTDEQLACQVDNKTEFMKKMDAYISIRAPRNPYESADVPSDKRQIFRKNYKKLMDERVENTKWVVLRYPNASMAQMAQTSRSRFADFYFDVCNLDYRKMSVAMDSLVSLMNRTDHVRIKAVDTDLTFSIKHIPAIKCDGKLNIPDGEVYTAPVADSVNGTIHYNTPSVYQGFCFEDVRFEFQDGKIVKATANDTKKINAILDTDDGARFIGEFAIGVNPYILKPIKDTLFDEKIMGSIHFTPGSCYEDASNGNHSSVHWDLVLIQTPEYGGGEIYFDNVLIRKDGLFVLPELLALNPENLK